MGTVFRSGIAALLCTGAWTAPALAQPAPEGRDSPILLDTVTVTANRREESLINVPATVSVIGREELDRRMIDTIDDAIRYEPDVSAPRSTTGSDPFSNVQGFRIRGVSGNRVQMQIDGSRVIESISYGNRDFFDLGTIGSVEIVRGPASVLWGADALGGVVSFRTRTPDDYLKGTGKRFAGEITTSFNSFDNSWAKSFAGAFQSEDGRWQSLLVMTHRTASEARLSKARADGGIWGCPRAPESLACDKLNPTDLDSVNVLGKLVFRPTEAQEFTLTLEGFRRKTGIDQRYDLGMTYGANNWTPTNIVNLGYLREQEQTRYRAMLSHGWDAPLPGFIDRVDWQVSYSQQKRGTDGDRYRRLANGNFEHLNAILDYEEKFIEGRVTLRSSFDTGPLKHTLTYGFDGDFAKTDYFRQDITRNITTGLTTIERGVGVNFANADTTRADGFIQNEISALDGRLTITPGLRFSHYRIDPRPDGDYKVLAGKEPSGTTKNKLTTRLAALFWATPNVGFYAQYSEGFKMPTAQQLYMSAPSVRGYFAVTNRYPNPDLRPESVRSYELGTRLRFANGFLRAGGFYADYKDFIQENVLIPGTVADYTSRNLSSVKIWGFEAAGEMRFMERWTAGLGVTWQRGEQRVNSTARKTAYDDATPLTAVTRLRYDDPVHNWSAELVGTFGAAVGSVSSPALFRPGGYAVFDGIFTWKPHERLTLKAGVYNMLDRRYFRWPLYTSASLSPTLGVARVQPLELMTAPGRTVHIGASLTF